jgi:hypothetical protein
VEGKETHTIKTSSFHILHLPRAKLQLLEYQPCQAHTSLPRRKFEVLMTSKKEILIEHHVAIRTLSQKFPSEDNNDDSTTWGVNLQGHEITSLSDVETAGSDSIIQISLPYVKEPPLEEEHACQKRSTRFITLIYPLENGG